MKRPTILILLLTAAWLLISCGRGTDHGYFPLGKGAAWEYNISYKVRGELRSHKRLLSNGPPVEVDEQLYYPRAELNGHRDYYQKTAAGIVHVDPVSGDKTLVLKYPLKQGQQWQARSKIRVLEVTGAFVPTFKARLVRPVSVTYRIEDTDDTISVAAGTFRHCLRVHGDGRLFAGRTLQEFMGIDSINIDQTDWYAPGVGLVKTVRDEYTEPNEFRNTYTRELQSYTRE
jgi:hypothetical protein